MCVTIQEVAASCDLNVKVIMRFWVNRDDALSKPNLRAEKIIKLGRAVGIEIRTIVVVKDKDKYSRHDILNKVKNG